MAVTKPSSLISRSPKSISDLPWHRTLVVPISGVLAGVCADVLVGTGVLVGTSVYVAVGALVSLGIGVAVLISSSVNRMSNLFGII